MGGGISFDSTGADEGAVKKKDPRRRNSFAFNISKFVQYEEEDYTPLINDIKEELAKQSQKKPKVTKFSKVADNILRGNNRELKFQVVNYQGINRKYGDQHMNYHILHMICQEGYVSMFEFLLEPKNHAESDHQTLEIDAENNKARTPLHLCFTPPTATHLGMKFGVDEEGTCFS